MTKVVYTDEGQNAADSHSMVASALAEYESEDLENSAHNLSQILARLDLGMFGVADVAVDIQDEIDHARFGWPVGSVNLEAAS